MNCGVYDRSSRECHNPISDSIDHNWNLKPGTGNSNKKVRPEQSDRPFYWLASTYAHLKSQIREEGELPPTPTPDENGYGGQDGGQAPAPPSQPPFDQLRRTSRISLDVLRLLGTGFRRRSFGAMVDKYYCCKNSIMRSHFFSDLQPLIFLSLSTAVSFFIGPSW